MWRPNKRARQGVGSIALELLEHRPLSPPKKFKGQQFSVVQAQTWLWRKHGLLRPTLSCQTSFYFSLGREYRFESFCRASIGRKRPDRPDRKHCSVARAARERF